jgi:putative restriction endonuclease
LFKLGVNLGFKDITDRSAIIKTIEEYDSMGSDAFLEHYGFGNSKSHYLKFNGRLYPSKAILGVSHKFQFPKVGPLGADEFAGGEDTVKPKLQELGFEILTIKEKAFAVITENDDSEWLNQTGELYHFPKRYLDLINPGTRVVYYKGSQKSKAFQDKRLSKEPHYFGLGIIGGVKLDPKSNKNDFFAEVIDFVPFNKPVLAKIDENYLETIPANRVTNYWRDGVRKIDKETFLAILIKSEWAEAASATELGSLEGTQSELNDSYQGLPEALITYKEGDKKQVYTTIFERDRRLRQQVVNLFGHTCQICGFNFEVTYGEHGKGYIHVHHLRPLSEVREGHHPNPKSDFAVVCANCHSMIHRSKKTTLAIDELKALILRSKGRKK